MTRDASDKITVEVAYALPEAQYILSLQVKPGTTALEAIALSGILQTLPEISAYPGGIGVFGKLVSGDYILQPRDRVEIYRPLLADPKQARRQRAAAKSGQTQRKP